MKNLKDKIIEFLKKNPKPTDKEFHKFIEGMGLDPDVGEAEAYAILGELLTSGESKGKIYKVNPKELAMGIKVELEHTGNKSIAEKITRDHLEEDPKYYSKLAIMERDMKKTKKFIKIFDNLFIKINMDNLTKAKIIKYIKRIKNPSGKGYIYFYTKEEFNKYKESPHKPEKEKSKGILSGIMSFFGISDKKQAQEKVDNIYNSNKDKLSGVDKITFSNYLNEYLSNKEKWDKKLQEKPKVIGKKKDGQKIAKKSSDKTVVMSGQAKKWDLSLMKRVAGVVGFVDKDNKSDVKNPEGITIDTPKDNFDQLIPGVKMPKTVVVDHVIEGKSEKQETYAKKFYDTFQKEMERLRNEPEKLKKLESSIEIPEEQKILNNKEMRIYEKIVSKFNDIGSFNASLLIDGSELAMEYINLVGERMLDKKSMLRYDARQQYFIEIFGDDTFNEIRSIVEDIVPEGKYIIPKEITPLNVHDEEEPSDVVGGVNGQTGDEQGTEVDGVWNKIENPSVVNITDPRTGEFKLADKKDILGTYDIGGEKAVLIKKDKGKFVVIEYKTGISLSSTSPTKKEALESAKNAVKRHGIDKIKEIVKDSKHVNKEENISDKKDNFSTMPEGEGEVKRDRIMSGADNFDNWLQSINSKEIKVSESTYPNSSSAYIYNTPVFSGEITTSYNPNYGQLIRADRLKGELKEQYDKLESKYAKPNKPFTFHDFNYALYDELHKNQKEEEQIKSKKEKFSINGILLDEKTGKNFEVYNQTTADLIVKKYKQQGIDLKSIRDRTGNYSFKKDNFDKINSEMNIEEKNKEPLKKAKIMKINGKYYWMDKAKKMPIGTISNGNKKVAEGKWVPVGTDKIKSKEKPEEKKDKKKKEPTTEENTVREKMKVALKKIATILADALSGKEVVQPTGSGVEEVGEKLKQKKKPLEKKDESKGKK